MSFRRFGCTVLQCTWGILQTLAGGAMFLVLIRRKHFIYRGCVVTEWKRPQSASVGMFVFLSDSLSGQFRDDVLIHEYGHTIQSLILGPLYLPVIALPSALWCMTPRFERMRRDNGISYYSFYPERWANTLGEKVTGNKPELLQ